MRSLVSLVAQRMVPLALLGSLEVMAPDKGGRGHLRQGKQVSGVLETLTTVHGHRKAPGPPVLETKLPFEQWCPRSTLHRAQKATL